ncbi:hypothetical protein HI113_13940 [Corallococcus exiguus]|uniref:hypothetical protein n=1 Tax=Corallococcus TaxID=83461 RepID=UPI000ECE34E3|nr:MULTISPECIES: hypothetical protein [Corallococcus]NNB94997.1 hypothetical protein [Corallococcus exiguus]NPC53258.1 hypothetical protein [Corallococcus exiguus]RKH74831.1 hypothetical protein D7X99_40290 [Corallococcus sp. AB032C]
MGASVDATEAIVKNAHLEHVTLLRQLGELMGAIRKVLESFDGSDETVQMQRELVENLAKLAEAKAEFFELQIATNLQTAGSTDNRTVPVEAVLDSATETHALTSESLNAIGDTVSKSLKSFLSGSKDDILKGVGSLISDALTIFLGGGSAGMDTLKRYYVMTEGLSIVRVDLMAWFLNVEAQGLKTKVEKVSAFSVVKSAVDLSRVKFNTFLNLYSSQLTKMNMDNERIEVALAEAEKIYRRFLEMPTLAVNEGQEPRDSQVSRLPGR